MDAKYYHDCAGATTGQTCYVSCAQGYDLSGATSEYTCGSSGTISGSLPTCVAKAGSSGVPLAEQNLDLNINANCGGMVMGESCEFFVEVAEIFDSQPFGTSAPEARFRGPQQRVLLEASLGGQLDAGFDEPELMGLEIAGHVGLANNDWVQRPAQCRPLHCHGHKLLQRCGKGLLRAGAEGAQLHRGRT